ncbi:MAG: hypothetical protein ACRDWG_18435 [Actinomycetes bacterium]|jgi:hypothetical protein
MAEIVLRVRLVGGGHLDVTYDEPASDEDGVIEHIALTLSHDAGLLRTRHGDRLIVLYARGVAAVEVAPRGPVL